MDKKAIRKAQQQARNFVYAEIKSGRMDIRSTCEICGSSGFLEMHHRDYNKPLDIIWLCRRCHTIKHTKNHPMYEEIIYPCAIKNTSAKTTRGMSQSIPMIIKDALAKKNISFREWCRNHGLDSRNVASLFAGRSLGRWGTMKTTKELLDMEFSGWDNNLTPAKASRNSHTNTSD